MALKTHFRNFNMPSPKLSPGFTYALCRRWVVNRRVTTEKQKVECRRCRKKLGLPT